MVYVIQFMLTACEQVVSINCMTYTIAVCTVQNSWWWTEELSETCRVLFKNKLEKLAQLVGFIIRIYHVAQSSECKKKTDLASVEDDKVNTTIVYYKNICFYNKHSTEVFVVIRNNSTRTFVFTINNSCVTSLSFNTLSHWNRREYFVLKLVSDISEILLHHYHSAGADEWRVCRSSHQDTDDTDAVTETFGINAIFIPLIAQVYFVLYSHRENLMSYRPAWH